MLYELKPGEYINTDYITKVNCIDNLAAKQEFEKDLEIGRERIMQGLRQRMPTNESIEAHRKRLDERLKTYGDKSYMLYFSDNNSIEVAEADFNNIKEMMNSK